MSVYDTYLLNPLLLCLYIYISIYLGGSYGGSGGAGYGINPVGLEYNDKQITDLLGGSGGCMRSVNAFEINSALGPTTGSGGHGGGAGMSMYVCACVCVCVCVCV
jgi:hypothetical protein